VAGGVGHLLFSKVIVICKRRLAEPYRLVAGGPELWANFMDELRAEHLGAPFPPDDRPRATERLAASSKR
jgi:hypothetical protein